MFLRARFSCVILLFAISQGIALFDDFPRLQQPLSWLQDVKRRIQYLVHIQGAASDASCESYDACADLAGDCCPTLDGVMLDCCSGGDDQSQQCRPCTTSDEGCTSPGVADQAWCDSRCSAGVNDPTICPISHCICQSSATQSPSTTPSYHPSVQPSMSPSIMSSREKHDDAILPSVTTPITVTTLIGSGGAGSTGGAATSHTGSPTHVLHSLLSYLQLFGLIAIYVTDQSANKVHKIFIDMWRSFSGYYSFVESHELSFMLWFAGSCLLAYIFSKIIICIEIEPSTSIFTVYNFFYLPAACLFLECLQSANDFGDGLFIVAASVLLFGIPIYDIFHGTIGIIKYYDKLVGAPSFILFRWLSHLLRALFLTSIYFTPKEKVLILCAVEIFALFIMIYLQPYYAESGIVFLYECFALFLTSIIYILYYLDDMEMLMGCQAAIASKRKTDY